MSKSNLAEGRIADLSSLADANGSSRSWPHATHSSLDQRHRPKNGISIGSTVFAERDQHTHTHKPIRQTTLQRLFDN